jgi:hypothetical protein
VAKLKSFDDAFAQFFQKLDAMGINASNTLFVVHSDENDHYAGSAPLNPAWTASPRPARTSGPGLAKSPRTCRCC